MHELSIAENMCGAVLRYANQHSAKRVTDLYVIVGDLASIEALEFHWGNVSQGTLAEGAQLHFELAPTIIQCHKCGQSYHYQPDADMPHTHEYECASCHSKNVEVMSGGETFRLDSIEIETEG